ncbi:splicing factor U2af large subunit A-like isoform X2 [Tripterygium wilfordii]|uniref:splicing factor U2af large subunit A-like isoform X2 n=1 Tax=Tripterygium wilfordii TaxID=458696 RepID=UPI0018F81BF8|nr:splicing factor U2af large subunit A-like isoform X2 [Tripterygium wilfordii]
MSDYDSRSGGESEREGLEDTSRRNKRDADVDASGVRDSHHKNKYYGSDHRQSRTRELDRHHENRDGRSVKEYRVRRNFDDYENRRDNYRRRDFVRGRGRRQRHRSRSLSRDRSENRHRSRSTSPSNGKSKRRSGFDVAPSGASMLPVASVQEQFPIASQTVPEMVQNMLQFGTSQLGALPLMPAQAMTQQATRHARRVYVGGLPPLANEQTIAIFFSRVMAAIGGNSAGPGDAVVNVYINNEKKFAFVEMRTVEEASNAMALDGIVFEGVAVRVRRPSDYNPALATGLGPSQPSPHLNLAAIGLTPGLIGGTEGPDRIFVGGVPYYFTESQIRELLESFGPLRGFDLVKDRDTGNSKGYGFCVYQDPAMTEIACASLNGLKMGDKTLTVRRATDSGQGKQQQENKFAEVQQHFAEQLWLQKMALQVGGMGLPGVGTLGVAYAEIPTKVLCLSEAVTEDLLKDDEEYEEILQDMQEECSKFGNLAGVVIPRPNSDGQQLPGVGKVFLEYADIAGCANARNALGGRKFGGSIVTAAYFSEDKYYSQDYSA